MIYVFITQSVQEPALGDLDIYVMCNDFLAVVASVQVAVSCSVSDVR